MNIDDYLSKMKDIQSSLLMFLDQQSNNEEKFSELLTLFNNHKIIENKNELKSLLHMILNIANDYHRSSIFFDLIKQILFYLKIPIKQSFSNYQIVNIFITNKKMLLLLIDLKIIDADKSFMNLITANKKSENNYIHYFLPEIKELISKDVYEKMSKELPENFEQLRQIGENNSYLCSLIRDDSIKEFVEFVNKTPISLSDAIIEPSIYETNSFLIDKNLTISEYASFFGSIQIINYLYYNKVDLDPSLITYAIHSKNYDLIDFIESLNKDINDTLLQQYINESIKCHHNEITNYFIDKHQQLLQNYFKQILKSYNFEFITYDPELFVQSFTYFCKYDYYIIVEMLLNSFDINDIDKPIIILC